MKILEVNLVCQDRDHAHSVLNDIDHRFVRLLSVIRDPTTEETNAYIEMEHDADPEFEAK